MKYCDKLMNIDDDLGKTFITLWNS